VLYSIFHHSLVLHRCIPDIRKLNVTFLPNFNNVSSADEISVNGTAGLNLTSSSDKSAVRRAIDLAIKSNNIGSEIFSDVFDSWAVILT
jgi:hypothetical protein